MAYKGKTKSIECDDFSVAVSQVLEEYFFNLTEDGNLLIAETAVECCQELKSTSPRDKGDYANDWAIKATRKNRLDQEIVIHNRKHYRLTHLLEHGHVKVVHGKVLGFTSPKVHIAPAERKAVLAFEKGWEIIIKGGGR